MVFFLAGAGASAAWFYHGSPHDGTAAAPDADNAAPLTLSDATKTILQNLNSPVEIRFYSMLDTSSVPDSVQAFAGRVDQLLAQYQQAGGKRVHVVRSTVLSNASARAALADGLKAFNIEKGDSCFLGIAIVCGSQKESISRLAPEWEQALEPDLTRAIARAAEPQPGAQTPAAPDTASFDAVKKALPNLDAMSLEDGKQALHDVSMGQFVQAAEEMKSQVEDAEQRFIQAQGSQSEQARQAAVLELQKIRAAGLLKLQKIAHDSQAQIVALQQIKQATP